MGELWAMLWAMPRWVSIWVLGVCTLSLSTRQ
jgi:hypothetical protein